MEKTQDALVYNNWKQTGLLDNISTEDGKILAMHLEKAAYTLLTEGWWSSKEDNPNATIDTVLFNVIQESYHMTIFSKNFDTPVRCLALSKFNVINILKDLQEYIRCFLSDKTLYLKNIDAEKDLLTIFCKNYVEGIFKEAIKDLNDNPVEIEVVETEVEFLNKIRTQIKNPTATHLGRRYLLSTIDKRIKNLTK